MTDLLLQGTQDDSAVYLPDLQVRSRMGSCIHHLRYRLSDELIFCYYIIISVRMMSHLLT